MIRSGVAHYQRRAAAAQEFSGASDSKNGIVKNLTLRLVIGNSSEEFFRIGEFLENFV